MALQGPILLIDDDPNDADVIATAIKELGIPNSVIHFLSADEAVAYLSITSEKPFLILCDIRMPGRDGLTLAKNIFDNELLRLKAIPFVFMAGTATQEMIDEAYRYGIHGFYLKPRGYVEMRDTLRTVVTYWLASKHPTSHYADKARLALRG